MAHDLSTKFCVILLTNKQAKWKHNLLGVVTTTTTPPVVMNCHAVVISETLHNTNLRTCETGTYSAQIGVHGFHAVSKTLMEQATSVPVSKPPSVQWNQSNYTHASSHNVRCSNVQSWWNPCGITSGIWQSRECSCEFCGDVNIRLSDTWWIFSLFWMVYADDLFHHLLLSVTYKGCWPFIQFVLR